MRIKGLICLQLATVACTVELRPAPPHLVQAGVQVDYSAGNLAPYVIHDAGSTTGRESAQYGAAAKTTTGRPPAHSAPLSVTAMSYDDFCDELAPDGATW